MQTLRDLRKQAGKSCAEVAEELGVTMRAVHKYEHGDRHITIEQVLILAQLYDVTAEEVIKAQLSSFNIPRYL